jgi:hypothetical protein
MPKGWTSGRAGNVEIDFTKPFSDEQKAYLAANIKGIESAAGVIAFDPKQPLSRTAAEQLKIVHKIAGEEKELTIWDTAQMAAKAGGAEAAHREKAELEKKQSRYDEFNKAVSEGKMPSDESLVAVAGILGVTKEQLVAGIASSDDDASAKPAKGKQAQAVGIDPSSKEFKDAVAATVREQFGKQLLPSEFHAQFLNDGFKAQTDKLLDAEIDKAIKANPVIAKLTKEAGDDKAKQDILTSLVGIFKSTVDQQARGRAIQIAQAGTGDIQEEIPNIVKGVVAQTDPTAILAKVAPQPIIFGASAPGEVPLTVLSKEKIARVPIDHADYEKNLARTMGQQIAQKLVVGSAV